MIEQTLLHFPTMCASSPIHMHLGHISACGWVSSHTVHHLHLMT